MAKSKSNSAVAPRYIIEDRLENQRRCIWRAQSICNIMSMAARNAQTGGSDPGAFTRDAWSAMEAVGLMLEDIASELEPDVVLDQRDAAGAQS